VGLGSFKLDYQLLLGKEPVLLPFHRKEKRSDCDKRLFEIKARVTDLGLTSISSWEK